MTDRTRHRVSLSLGAACIVALLSTLARADADASSSGKVDGAASRGWKCALCPKPGGWAGRVDAGAGWVSDSSPKYGDYRGLNQQGGFAALDGDAHYRDSAGRFVDARASDLGIDSRHLSIRGGVRGRYALEFNYREIPKYRGFGAETVFLGTGGGELALPANWQQATRTGDMGSLADSLQPAGLEIVRKRVDLGLSGRLGSRWSYEAAFEHQRKQGTRPFGAGVFTIHSSHFPAPVDFSTNRLLTGLSYAGEAAHWRLAFSGATFRNDFQSVTWPNPFTPLPGTEVLRASLEPDNRFNQLEFAGGWKLSQYLRLTGSAAVGRMEQDDLLLPASSNPDFSEVPIPRASADARINTGTINLGGRAELRLTPRFYLTVRLRRDDRDNHTPVDSFLPIITDIVPREPRPNRPYSFERDRASLSMRYRIHAAVRVQAGMNLENIERSLQSVRETEERGYWGEITFSRSSRAELRARFEQTNRDAGAYLQLEDGGPVEHPLMRKFHLADRHRERLKFDLDLFPVPELTMTVGYQDHSDRFEHSMIGLQSSEERTLSLDAGWSVSERMQVHGFVSRDKIESAMFSAESAFATAWTGMTLDRFLTAGIGAQITADPRWQLDLDLVRSRSKGEMQTVSQQSGGFFPALETDLWNARLRANYRFTGHWAMKAMLEYESYHSLDWGLDGLGPAGIPAILSLGQESPDYRVFVLRLQASYRF